MKTSTVFPPLLSQEGLKLIACVTMLIDHFGAAFFPDLEWMRIVGRLAFPIYCFLLTEGLRHTRSPKKYFLRLCLAALISELPFDLALFGGRPYIYYNNVLLTLVLGFVALYALQNAKSLRSGIVAVFAVPACYWLADLMHTDYGGDGVLMVLAFGVAGMLPFTNLWQLALVSLVAQRIGGFRVYLGAYPVPVEIFGLLALPLIWCYSGKKKWNSKKLSLFFYSFYPLHLTILYIIILFVRR